MGIESETINSNNRYVEGAKNAKLVAVQGGVTVSIGDLMFLDNSNNLRNNGSSTADYHAYPVACLRSGTSIETNKNELKERFLGVALDDKDGVANSPEINISIASSGKFIFDLKPNKTVDIGKYFGPSGTTSNSDIFNQKVMLTTDVTQALGFFAERKVHAQKAELTLRCAFSSLGTI